MSTRHPTRYQLDRLASRLLEGEAEEEARRHLAGCDACKAYLADVEATDRAFLARYPTPAALGVDRPPRRRRGLLPPMLGAVAVVGACAALTLLVLPRARPPETARPEGGAVRIKGTSAMELLVRRAGRSWAFAGEVLRPGDVLAFRYTSRRRFLLLLGVELSGKISPYVPEHGPESRPIVAGERVFLDQGVELDEYRGPERLVAVLSDEPLAVEAVTAAVRARMEEMDHEARHAVPVTDLSFPDADVLSWLIEKEAP